MKTISTSGSIPFHQIYQINTYKNIFIIPHRQLVGQPTAKGQQEINNKIKYIPDTNDKLHVYLRLSSNIQTLVIRSGIQHLT